MQENPGDDGHADAAAQLVASLPRGSVGHHAPS
jgi:hypothetical protein